MTQAVTGLFTKKASKHAIAAARTKQSTEHAIKWWIEKKYPEFFTKGNVTYTFNIENNKGFISLINTQGQEIAQFTCDINPGTSVYNVWTIQLVETPEMKKAKYMKIEQGVKGITQQVKKSVDDMKQSGKDWSLDHNDEVAESQFWQIMTWYQNIAKKLKELENLIHKRVKIDGKNIFSVLWSIKKEQTILSRKFQTYKSQYLWNNIQHKTVADMMKYLNLHNSIENQQILRKKGVLEAFNEKILERNEVIERLKEITKIWNRADIREKQLKGVIWEKFQPWDDNIQRLKKLEYIQERATHQRWNKEKIYFWLSKQIEDDIDSLALKRNNS